jgi:hypothetical protein
MLFIYLRSLLWNLLPITRQLVQEFIASVGLTLPFVWPAAPNKRREQFLYLYQWCVTFCYCRHLKKDLLYLYPTTSERFKGICFGILVLYVCFHCTYIERYQWFADQFE